MRACAGVWRASRKLSDCSRAGSGQTEHLAYQTLDSQLPPLRKHCLGAAHVVVSVRHVARALETFTHSLDELEARAHL